MQKFDADDLPVLVILVGDIGWDVEVDDELDEVVFLFIGERFMLEKQLSGYSSITIYLYIFYIKSNN